MAGGGVPEAASDEEEGGGFVEPNIVPLVDIMLVLLVILMAGSSAIVQAGGAGESPGSGFRVNLPSATGDQVVDDISNEIVLTVLESGEAVLRDEVYRPEALEAPLTAEAQADPDRLVLVQADEQTPHARVVAVMEACRRAGLRNLAIATKGEDPGRPIPSP